MKQKKIRNENSLPTIVLSTDEETDLDSALVQLLHELEEYHSNLVEEKGKLQNLSGSQADDRLVVCLSNGRYCFSHCSFFNSKLSSIIFNSFKL